MRMKLVSTFIGPGGREWKVYHGKRTQHREQFTNPHTGKLCLGITWFRGKYAGKIFIDSSQKPAMMFEISVHELMHVAMEDLGLHALIEESIVDETSARLALMLEQL